MTPERASEVAEAVAVVARAIGTKDVEPKVATKYAMPRDRQSRAFVYAAGICVWCADVDGLESFIDDRLEAACASKGDA